MPDLHVLVHDPLPFLLAEQVPVGAFGEGVHDQVLRALSAEERLLLLSWTLDVLGRPNDAEEAVTWRHPCAHPSPHPGRDLFLERLDAGCKAPEHEVDAGLEADHRVGERRDVRLSRKRGAEVLGRTASIIAGLAAPGGIQ